MMRLNPVSTSVVPELTLSLPTECTFEFHTESDFFGKGCEKVLSHENGGPARTSIGAEDCQSCERNEKV